MQTRTHLPHSRPPADALPHPCHCTAEGKRAEEGRAAGGAAGCGGAGGSALAAPGRAARGSGPAATRAGGAGGTSKPVGQAIGSLQRRAAGGRGAAAGSAAAAAGEPGGGGPAGAAAGACTHEHLPTDHQGRGEWQLGKGGARLCWAVLAGMREGPFRPTQPYPQHEWLLPWTPSAPPPCRRSLIWYVPARRPPPPAPHRLASMSRSLPVQRPSWGCAPTRRRWQQLAWQDRPTPRRRRGRAGKHARPLHVCLLAGRHCLPSLWAPHTPAIRHRLSGPPSAHTPCSNPRPYLLPGCSTTWAPALSSRTRWLVCWTRSCRRPLSQTPHRSGCCEHWR